MTGFQTRKSGAFIQSPMLARNLVGDQFISVGFSGFQWPGNVAQRIYHGIGFNGVGSPGHWHSTHFPPGFEDDRSYAGAPSATGSISLPASLTGWHRCLIRIKGVVQSFPQLASYDYIRLEGYGNIPCPIYLLGGAGIQGHTAPNFTSRNNFGEANSQVIGPTPIHGANNIVLNYGAADVVSEVDKIVEFSINTNLGRTVVFGANGAWGFVNSGVSREYVGGSMPDGETSPSNGGEGVAIIGAVMGSGGTVTPQAIYYSNPGINPTSLIPPHAPMFTDTTHTHQLIGQFLGSRQESTGRDPIISSY